MKSQSAIITTALSMFFTLAQQSTVYAGPANGGGGHSVYCSADPEHGFMKDGHYSLDYALTAKNAERAKLNPSLEQQLQKIAKGFENIPALQQRFQLFVTNRENEIYFDSEHRYVWSDASALLLPTEDENLDRQLPDNCQVKKSDRGLVLLQQVTVREEINKNVINFKINGKRLAELKETSDLQLSYHLVHEFLRDYIDDAIQIRKINNLLHDPRFENISESTLITNLQNLKMGFFIGKSEVAQRNEEKRELLSMLSFENQGDQAIAIETIKQYSRNKLDLTKFASQADGSIAYVCSFTHSDRTYRTETSKGIVTTNADGTYKMDLILRGFASLAEIGLQKVTSGSSLTGRWLYTTRGHSYTGHETYIRTSDKGLVGYSVATECNLFSTGKTYISSVFTCQILK